MGKKEKNKLVQNNKAFFRQNLLDNEVYSYYYNIFFQICLAIFEWENLPATMNARYLEKTLFEQGQSALLWDKERLYINMPCVLSGEINIYEEPTQVTCTSVGFHTQRLVYKGKKDNAKATDCVVVYNNQTHLPTVSMIDLYAYKLYLIDMISLININAQKTPMLIIGDESTKLALQNIYDKIEANEFKLILKKNFDVDALKTLDLKAPYIADKLAQLKYDVWNEALTALGINNIRDKKERLVKEESEQNNELINFNLQSYFVPRKEACRQFNELFKLEKPVSVKVRSDLHNVIKQYESIAGIKPGTEKKENAL